MNEMVREIYDRTDREMASKEAQLVYLRSRLDSLTHLVESLVAAQTPPDSPSETE